VAAVVVAVVVAVAAVVVVGVVAVAAVVVEAAAVVAVAVVVAVVVVVSFNGCWSKQEMRLKGPFSSSPPSSTSYTQMLTLHAMEHAAISMPPPHSFGLAMRCT